MSMVRRIVVGTLKLPFFLVGCVLWAALGLFIAYLAPSTPMQTQADETMDTAFERWPRGFANIWELFYGKVPDDL